MAKHDKISIKPATVLAPVPAVMVSCAGQNPENKASRPNIITIAWAGTVNSEPPMVSISVRQSRHSHKLIEDTGEFVINLVNKSLCKACDFCGVKSGADIDKFEACGLNAVKAEGLQFAYAIKEAPLSLSCKVVSKEVLPSHDVFTAEVVAVTADSYLLDDNGRLCLDKGRLVAYNHGEYFLLGEKLGFFGYSVASPEVYKKRMGKD